MENSKKQNIENIEVEIISLNNLRGFLKGKLKGVVENVMVSLPKEEKPLKESVHPFISLKKIKVFFKPKSPINQDGGETIERMGRKSYKVFIFFSVISLFLGVFFIVVKGFFVNKVDIKPTDPFTIKNPELTKPEGISFVGEEDPEKAGETDYSKLKIKHLLDGNQTVNIKAGQEEKKENNLWNKFLEKTNLKEPEIVEKKITKEDIYAYILKSAKNVGLGKIYFLNIADSSGKKISLDQLAEIMGINLGPSWKESMAPSLLDYGMAFYLEEDKTEPINGVRIGLLLLLKQDKANTVDYFSKWEGSLVKDMTPLFLGNNQKLVSDNNNFNWSTISPERKYVNFDPKGLASLDYALVSDGAVIITSKNFGSAMIKLFKKNNEQNEPTELKEVDPQQISPIELPIENEPKTP
jgi:hypothetical protein